MEAVKNILIGLLALTLGYLVVYLCIRFFLWVMGGLIVIAALILILTALHDIGEILR